MQKESISWEAPSEAATKKPIDIEIESLFRNFDQKNLVAPLREVHEVRSHRANGGSEAKHRAALDLQEKWEGWLVQRELLRNEIKRGKELLEQTQRELAALRGRLEEWPGYERVCGKNPLLDYMQAIIAHERLEQFLPVWLQRRETQLRSLSRTLENCARENGLEHLL
jgi:hypothetical protein